MSSMYRSKAVTLALALAAYHIREQGGNNKGRVVEALLRWAGGSAGMPWCAATVDYIYETACILAGEPMVLNPGLSCSAFAAQAKKLGRLFTDVKLALPGDFFILNGGDSGYKHTGVIVAACSAEGDFPTVEGNTNDAGSAEGDGIYERTRNQRRTPCVFVRAI